MLKTTLIAAFAATAVVSFAAPSNAGGFSIGFGDHHGGHVALGFYGDPYYADYRDAYYGGYYEEPVCYIKKIKKHDKWGNVFIKKVKFCD